MKAINLDGNTRLRLNERTGGQLGALATSLPDAALTLYYYRRWMWIEEMLANFKKHGFNLESTMLCNISFDFGCDPLYLIPC